MTILDYIAANPGCSGGEIAAALNTPTTAINAELRRLWRSGSVIRKERKTGGRFSYQINPMPFGCGNPLTASTITGVSRKALAVCCAGAAG